MSNDGNSIVALLNAINKNNGYTMQVKSFTHTKGVARIYLDEPERMVTVSSRVFAKIKPFLLVQKTKNHTKD